MSPVRTILLAVLLDDPELFPIRGLGGLEEILKWMLSRPPSFLARPPV